MCLQRPFLPPRFWLQIRFFVLDEADRLLDSEDVIMKLFRRLPKGGAGLARLQVGSSGLKKEAVVVLVGFSQCTLLLSATKQCLDAQCVGPGGRRAGAPAGGGLVGLAVVHVVMPHQSWGLHWAVVRRFSCADGTSSRIAELKPDNKDTPTSDTTAPH